ncbi:MAG: pseudouridine synthase [Myxococcota bacterium]|jgi:tRNA pseudouridine65 synthase
MNVLYRDSRLLAVYKPSGLPVHRGMDRSPVTLVDMVRDETGMPVAYPIHRLDRGTSGVVLFAMDAEAARVMQALLQGGGVRKTYLAIVRGVTPPEGLIDHPVPRRPGGERVDAVTRFKRLSSAVIEPREASLVELEPVTGRFHQLRRHMKHINHPIIGDSNYGKSSLNIAFRELHGLARLALHAVSLGFIHPFTGKRLEIVSALPADLSEPMKSMGLSVRSSSGP